MHKWCLCGMRDSEDCVHVLVAWLEWDALMLWEGSKICMSSRQCQIHQKKDELKDVWNAIINQ